MKQLSELKSLLLRFDLVRSILSFKEIYFPDKVSRRPRIWSNNELSKIAHLFTGDVINVSGWRDEDKRGKKYKDYFINATSYCISNYNSKQMGYQGGVEGEILLDLEKPIPYQLHERFDVVFNHTTLEHIFEIEQAFRNLCHMTKDIVIIILPFLQQMHYGEGYKDYWRFTPFTLQKLFKKNGMEMIYCSGEDTSNSSVYVFAVGSKHPERWNLKLDPEIFKKLGHKIIG